MNFAWAKPAILAGLAALVLSGCGRGEPPVPTEVDAATIKAAQDFLIENGKQDGVVTTPTGLQYKVVKASTKADAVAPDSNDLVRVHYEGTLTNGTVFDSSFERGTPAVFSPDQVVPGWTEALQLMKPGDEWLLYVPPALGYGDNPAGPIPPHSVLVFRLQMLDVAPVPGGTRGVGQANG